MRITGPTNPFHLARAYGTPNPALTRVTAPRAEEAVARIEPTRAARLIAATIRPAPPQAPADPAPGEPLAMYRHPADRNAAATALQAGRAIDTTG